MHRRVVITVAVLVLAFALPLAAVQASPNNFAAPLSGDQEVPAVDTRATGVGIFHLGGDGSELSYRLNVANIENVTQAHIHLGARGENGGVVAWLYPDGPPDILIPGRTNGTLATGTITDADLVGALAGQTVADLVDLIEAGQAYVNVHTSENPGGEIRGQIDVPRRGAPNSL